MKAIVDEWSKMYINQVFYTNSYENIHDYYVEFSRPAKLKPIPQGTVKVYFYIIEIDPDQA